MALPAMGLAIAVPAGAGTTPTSKSAAVTSTAAAPTTPAAARPPCPPNGVSPVVATTAASRWQPKFPIRAAFYYGWGSTSTHYTPTYGSDDPCVHTDAPQRNVSHMRYGGMNAGIASWWGRGSASDVRFPSQLRAADRTRFRWALYYELANRSQTQIAVDLKYIAERHARDKTYLKVNGKPVLFVWAGGANNCSITHTWQSVNRDRFYLVMKNYYGMSSCKYHGSDWHAYGPASRTLSVPGHSYSISPGFWRNGDAHPVLGRDSHAWDRAIAAMISSKAHWQLITTFNEWGENTSVESATQWRTGTHKGAYLDLLHRRLGTAD